jgi:hypothetical protein
MTDEKKVEAIRQMLVSCELAASDCHRMLSARGCLNELGFDAEEVDEVIGFIAAGGFDYCLDPWVPMTGHHDAAGRCPRPDDCFWDPDQLASRLRFLRNVPRDLLVV